MIEMCQKCTTDVVLPNVVNHHRSKGCIYSFLNQGILKNVSYITIGPYVIRKRYADETHVVINDIASNIKISLSDEIFAVGEQLSCVIPNLGQLLFPVLDTGHQLQKKFGGMFLKKESNWHGSMWNICVFVNDSTVDYQCEYLFSYTLINIPQHDTIATKMNIHIYQFMFMLNKNDCIALNLFPNITSIFCAPIKHINRDAMIILDQMGTYLWIYVPMTNIGYSHIYVSRSLWIHRIHLFQFQYN